MNMTANEITPSQRLADALNAFDEETKELRRADRSEIGWISSVTANRCWFDDCADLHPDHDGALTDAMDLDDGTLGAIDGMTVTPSGSGRWVVSDPASDYLEGETQYDSDGFRIETHDFEPLID